MQEKHCAVPAEACTVPGKFDATAASHAQRLAALKNAPNSSAQGQAPLLTTSDVYPLHTGFRQRQSAPLGSLAKRENPSGAVFDMQAPRQHQSDAALPQKYDLSVEQRMEGQSIDKNFELAQQAAHL